MLRISHTGWIGAWLVDQGWLQYGFVEFHAHSVVVLWAVV